MRTSIVAALVIVGMTACDNTTGPVRTPELAVIDVSPTVGPSFTLSDSTAAGGAIWLGIDAYGNLCTRPGEISHSWNGDVLELRPMTWSHPEDYDLSAPCLQRLETVRVEGTVPVRSDLSGAELSVRIIGRNSPAGDTITISELVPLR